VLSGHPHLTVAVHGTEPGEPGAAGGGNATAANRIVNAIPAVGEARHGVLGPFDIGPVTGAPQLRLHA
jgi:2,4-diaminopentanoate dehydrogenase